MRCTISQTYFDKELYMFRTDLMSIIRSLNTVYTGIGICHASYVDCLLARSGSNSVPSWLHENPTSESWWVHPRTLWLLHQTVSAVGTIILQTQHTYTGRFIMYFGITKIFIIGKP